MPATPYPISGIVYAPDNTTAVNGAKVVAYNSTSGEATATTSNSSGEYIVDLANLTSGYDSGDVIYLSAFTGRRSVDYRTTTTAGDDVGGSESKDLYLMWGQTHAVNINSSNAFHSVMNTRLLSGIVTAGAANIGVVFYDIKNDVEVLHVKALANASQEFDFGRPKYFEGLARVPSANTAKACIQADV